MAKYTNSHRLFLQSLLSRRFLSEKLAQKLWQRACEVVAAAESSELSTQAFPQALEQIANALSPLSLELRSLVDEATREKMLAIVNTKGDAIAQVATDFSANEIAYFKLIVECIMLAPSESFSLSSIAAIKESANLPGKMTKTEAEGTLNAFVSRGWLVRSKRGRYSLSTRSILELQGYLKSTFEDEVQECTICMEICTKGIACPTARCKTHMHTHCYDNYRMLRRVCPSCNAPWDGRRPIPVGEEAVQDRLDGRGGRRRRVQEEEEELEEEEVRGMEMEEEQDVQATGDEDEEVVDELMHEEVEEVEEEEEQTPAPRRRRRQQHASSRFVDDEADY